MRTEQHKSTDQGSTAEQNHEDDEGFKPVVFNDQVAGLSEEPPVLPPTMSDGNITALVFGHALCTTNQNHSWRNSYKQSRDKCRHRRH